MAVFLPTLHILQKFSLSLPSKKTETTMKLVKYFTAIVLLFVATLVSAQQTSHLTFKGVPICGSLKEFSNKMVAKGLTLVGSTKEGVVFSGSFTTYSRCSIVATVVPPSNEVTNVLVMFPNNDEWSDLESNYFSIKSMLQEKYGDSKECVEEFEGSVPKDDYSKMLAVRLDKLKCQTIYEVEGGSIVLMITKGSAGEPVVVLNYHDGVNDEQNRKRALEDL